MTMRGNLYYLPASQSQAEYDRLPVAYCLQNPQAPQSPPTHEELVNSNINE